MSWQTIVKENNLEIASVLFSELNKETRLDAEYYRPEALLYLEYLEQKKAVPISSLAKFVVGPFGSTVTVDMYVDDEEYSYVRNQDIGSFEIHTSDAHIPKELFEKLKQFHIKEDDLLVTVVGTLGKVAVAQPKDTKSIFSCKSTIIRCNDVDPYYLATFLNSKIGQTLLLRCKRGAIQEGLNLFDIKTLNASVPSAQFQTQIRDVIKNVFTLSKKAELSYAEAEQMLLREVNLVGYKGPDEAVSVRNFSEALADNRFDAEYWQPDYDVIQNAIKKHKDGCDTFDNLFDISDKKIAIDPEKAYLYAELADVNGAMGTIDNFTELRGKELPSRGRMSLKKNDVVMSSLDGSLNKIALVTSDAKNIIGSTGFFVLRQKEYEPEVALVLLKSKPIQTLLERQGQGTILSAIPKHSLSRVVLPKLNQTIQKKIRELVLSVHAQKEEAEALLEKAKRAVEIFIEKDEKEASLYLNS